MAVPRFSFTIEILKGEDGYFVAYCKEIPGVASQGRTVEEARNNVLEALYAAIETLAQDAPSRSTPPGQGRPVWTSRVDLVPA